jgi:hypothetical protein
MALCTTAYVMQMAGVQATDAPTVARYDLLRRSVEKAVKTYTKWELEQNSVIEYYDGTGKLELTLRNPYVISIQNLWEDDQGNYGATSGSFASTSLLTSGTDYALVLENGISRNGMVRRIQNSFLWWPGLWAPGYQQASGGLAWQYGAYWNPGQGNIKVQYTYGFPSATPVSTLAWASGVLTVTTSVAHGFNVGMYAALYGCSPAEYNISNKVESVGTPTTLTMNMPYPPSVNSGTGGSVDGVPEDIKLAVVEAVAIIKNSTKYGYPVTSESMGDYNYSLSRDKEFTNARDILNAYRNTALGIIA